MPSETEQTIDSAGDKRPPFDFVSSRQRRLYRVLIEHDGSLGAMYWGGLQALDDETNPDRFAQSAHSFRELMEKAPRSIAVPEKTKHKKAKYSLKNAVDNVRDVWSATKTRSKNYNSAGEWSGSIDKHLWSLLLKLDKFFATTQEYRPNAPDEYIQMHRRIDPSGVPLTEQFERRIAGEWGSINDFFQKVAHHGIEPTSNDFQTYVDRMEELLIALLIPQTFEDYSALDQLIDEIEGR